MEEEQGRIPPLPDHGFTVCFPDGNGAWGPGFDLTAHDIPADGGIASVSPDGRYLFYIHDGDLYWVSTTLIESLREN